MERRLRLLLWKHGLPEYNQPGLNLGELVERLQQKVVRWINETVIATSFAG